VQHQQRLTQRELPKIARIEVQKAQGSKPGPRSFNFGDFWQFWALLAILFIS
jgi:hypothetical protein